MFMSQTTQCWPLLEHVPNTLLAASSHEPKVRYYTSWAEFLLEPSLRRGVASGMVLSFFKLLGFVMYAKSYCFHTNSRFQTMTTLLFGYSITVLMNNSFCYFTYWNWFIKLKINVIYARCVSLKIVWLLIILFALYIVCFVGQKVEQIINVLFS